MSYKKIIINKKYKKIKGALLLELLIVISLLAAIFMVGTQAILVSLRSDENSSKRDVEYNLALETLELVRNVSEENWQNIYSPIGIEKGVTHYYPLKVNNVWTLSQGNEIVVINGISYTRYIIIDNVSRDTSTNRNIEASYNAINDDPNTQKVTTNVSSTNRNSVIVNGYLFRWKNVICSQTSWTTETTPVDTAVSCPSTSFFSIDSGIDISTVGSLVLTGTTPKAISGTLISPVFDSGAVGAGYNSIMWKGSLGGVGLNEGRVRFQLAGSNSESGPWNYYGGDTCGSSDYFNPSASNTPIELKGDSCFSGWNNTRYFRYKIQICSDDCISAGNETPIVDDVIISWTP